MRASHLLLSPQYNLNAARFARPLLTDTLKVGVYAPVVQLLCLPNMGFQSRRNDTNLDGAFSLQPRHLLDGAPHARLPLQARGRGILGLEMHRLAPGSCFHQLLQLRAQAGIVVDGQAREEGTSKIRFSLHHTNMRQRICVSHPSPCCSTML